MGNRGGGAIKGKRKWAGPEEAESLEHHGSLQEGPGFCGGKDKQIIIIIETILNILWKYLKLGGKGEK